MKVFNERGVCALRGLCHRAAGPRTCYVDHGARLDPIIPGWLDRGGDINTITPTSTTSKNATGMAVSGFLAQVERVTDEERRRGRRLIRRHLPESSIPLRASAWRAGWLNKKTAPLPHLWQRRFIKEVPTFLTDPRSYLNSCLGRVGAKAAEVSKAAQLPQPFCD